MSSPPKRWEGPLHTPAASLANPSGSVSFPGAHSDAWLLGRSLMVLTVPGVSPLPTEGLW